MTTEKENFPEKLRAVWPFTVKQFAEIGQYVPEVAEALCAALSDPTKPVTDRAADYIEQLEEANLRLTACLSSAVSERDTWKAVAEGHRKSREAIGNAVEAMRTAGGSIEFQQAFDKAKDLVGGK